ncbi:alpha-L-fucosidase [Actinomadura barringtoniae]|uniref:alpha-L-fucosidase n=1 Tax=Actinomadura barringtoniae TaxID=1427535 RepID=A0A939T913_9ACTN|nr:alpha-L-fucosidase [Actinomadura barringtoniae]MBO2453774.1 alpha-L-fucosidase [Actinomadura barringtoniae]
MARHPRSRLLCVLAVLALLAGLLAAIPAPPARAEVEHPRQKWMRDSTAGLFLHWGMFTSPRHLDCATWEKDVTGGGWSPDYWVDEARKLGASYIVLATFHSRLGYARPWPSAIPGSCSTKRDLLGELVKAGQAKGVRVLLYMTDDPQWHNETGTETLDSAAYSAYKGEQVDLTTRPGFGEYSYDLFFEVMDRYPDLAGFWIDNDNEYWESHHLYEQIRQKRPSWLLSNNNEDTPIMDTVSNEQKVGMTPAYDYPQAAWTPMPRLVEADYKLPTTGDWWYDGSDHSVDFRLSTGRYITNAGSSMKSLMAETPMVNGKFPPSQEKFNDFMAGWVPPIKSSLQGLEGGGYMYGGMQPGFWNDGAHGVVTVDRGGAKTQYVHVVTRPRTDHVRLRDDNYRVTRVTDLRTGKAMHFTQSGGYLSILDVTAWDDYDTVFKVDTAGQGLYYSGVKASASASRTGFPAADLTDGDFSNYWDSNAQLPVSMTFDLGARRPATTLAVNQREWSPTYARTSFGRPEDSARIKDYRVRASDDGRAWRQVRSGAMASARGVRLIDLGLQYTRYLKLEVLNLWGGPQAPAFLNQLKVDEVKVGYGYQRSFGRPLPLEAEAHGNVLSHGARRTLCTACSGNLHVVGGELTYRDVNAPSDGDYRLQADTTSAKATPLRVTVNGGEPTTLTVPAGSADAPDSTALAVHLKAGANTVKLSGPGIDRISVSPVPTDLPRTTMTVEPYGVQWVGTGRQTLKVKATLRLDTDDQLDGVELAPKVPDGWTLDGASVKADSLRLGQTITGTWTVTSPDPVAATKIPVNATYRTLGRPQTTTRNLDVRPRPADRTFMREAEDSANAPGSTGLTGCGPCSGGEKVRNIGGDPTAAVTFPNVTTDRAGQHTLYIDYTVNGTRSYQVSVNGGPPATVTVTDSGNSTPRTTSLPVTLQSGANTIKIYNDAEAAPDLDRISLD